MSDLATRLRRAQRAGNLTVADLARWLDRPDPTVRGWLNGTGVGGPPLDREHVDAMLGLLEALIARKKGFPVPRLPATKRRDHLARIRQACLGD